MIKWICIGITALLLANSGWMVYNTKQCIKERGTIMMSYAKFGVTCLK